MELFGSTAYEGQRCWSKDFRNWISLCRNVSEIKLAVFTKVFKNLKIEPCKNLHIVHKENSSISNMENKWTLRVKRRWKQLRARWKSFPHAAEEKEGIVYGIRLFALHELMKKTEYCQLYWQFVIWFVTVDLFCLVCHCHYLLCHYP